MPRQSLVNWIANMQAGIKQVQPKIVTTEKCVHRGATISSTTRKCCGKVDTFYCSFVKDNVESTRCKSCPESPLLANVCRPVVDTRASYCGKYAFVTTKNICARCQKLEGTSKDHFILDIKAATKSRVTKCICLRDLSRRIGVVTPKGAAFVQRINCQFFEDNRYDVDCFACDFYVRDDGSNTCSSSCQSLMEPGNFNENLLRPCVYRAFVVGNEELITCNRGLPVTGPVSRDIRTCMSCTKMEW